METIKNVKVLNQKFGTNWVMYHGDNVEILKGIPDNSIHYQIFSPPFISLFIYSNSERDIGNCKTDKEFYDHFKFFIKECFRITMPGRLVSIHCMNVPAMKERDGYIGLKDFRGDIIRGFQKEGFIYHSEVCIWKDPLIEATRTKALGLMYKQVCKDSSMTRMGLPDYIVTMRKPGENPEKISHPEPTKHFIGNPEQNPDTKQAKGNGYGQKVTGVEYAHNVWRRYASPIWMDINQTRTLNYRVARENDDERHICPLQLDSIARCLQLWTNQGDVVLSPFAGIGSEGYESIRMGRKFVGIELKESYFNQACKYLKEIEDAPKQLELFK